MNSDSMRLVQVLKDDVWVDVEFSDIKKGDIVRMFEPNGERVEGFGGTGVFRAICDAFIDVEHNVYSFAYEEE